MENKTCPFCGETILATAKKCRYCDEWLDTDAEAMPTAESVIVEKKRNTAALFSLCSSFAIGLWAATNWRWALTLFVVMFILLYIPVIGHITSVLLGIVCGVIAAVTSHALNAPNWAALLIGGVVGLGMTAYILKARKG